MNFLAKTIYRTIPATKSALRNGSLGLVFSRNFARYVSPVFPNPEVYDLEEMKQERVDNKKGYVDLESIYDEEDDKEDPEFYYEPVNWTINQIAKDPSISNRMHEYYKRCIMKLPPTTRKEFFFNEKMKLRELYEGDWPILPPLVPPSTLSKDAPVELWTYDKWRKAVIDGEYKETNATNTSKASNSQGKDIVDTGSNGRFSKDEVNTLENKQVNFDLEALRTQVDMYKKQNTEDKAQFMDDHDAMSVVINTRGVSRTTAQGRMRKETCLIVCGNTHGAVGLGYGKDREFAKASLKAINEARSNMICVELFEDRTFFSDLHGKFNSTEVDIYPAYEGYGIKGNDIAWSILYCLGVTDAIVKVRGNQNPFTTVQAIFNALSKSISVEEYALNTGARFIDIMHLKYWRNKV
ncbi:hypothetical protein WA158_007422 [Blastocystis sp. Blastoise]